MSSNNFGPITSLANKSLAVTAVLGLGGIALIIVALFLVPLAGMGYVPWFAFIFPLVVAVPSLVTFWKVTRF